jgi:Tfp pilus assembly protein PilF
MPKPKSERALSKRSAERRHGLQAAALALLALTLGACGSSTPRRADVEPARERATTQAPSASAATTEPQRAAPEPAPRRERRGERGSEPRAHDAAALAGEPVPEAAAAAHARALAAMRAENWLEAELTLEQLTLEHPLYPGPHVNLAIVYLEEGRRADARAALERALALDPEHAAANTQLGILLREQGEFSAAEAAYRRALARDPDHALAHFNLAVLLDVYLRRAAEALEHYERYQSSLAEPNETVGRWIIDLRRRVGNGEAARVAQEERP